MSHRHFPFHPLGFRCNPFRALTREEWEELAVLPPAVEQALNQGADHLQLLGPKGRGKTTALLALAARLRQEGLQAAYEHLPEGEQRFHTRLDGLDAFLLDEAQRLTGRERRRLLAAAERIRLVLASHQDFASRFARRGLRLATVSLGVPDPDHLAVVLQRRLAYFTLLQPPPVRFTTDAIEYLQQTFEGDLRAIEYFLYELFQRLRTTGPVNAEALRRLGPVRSDG